MYLSVAGSKRFRVLCWNSTSRAPSVSNGRTTTAWWSNDWGSSATMSVAFRCSGMVDFRWSKGRCGKITTWVCLASALETNKRELQPRSAPSPGPLANGRSPARYVGRHGQEMSYLLPGTHWVAKTWGLRVSLGRDRSHIPHHSQAVAVLPSRTEFWTAFPCVLRIRAAGLIARFCRFHRMCAPLDNIRSRVRLAAIICVDSECSTPVRGLNTMSRSSFPLQRVVWLCARAGLVISD